MNRENIISIKDLSKIARIGGYPLLNSVNLDIKRGDFMGLMGLNGAGKSTLLNIIGSIYRPSSGKVTINGHDVVLNRTAAIRSVGFMTQGPSFDGMMSVRDIILLHAKLYGASDRDAEKRLDEVLEVCNLSWARDVIPYLRLSGGEQQRVLLARTLITDAPILVLDEPTTGIDFTTGTAIWKYIKHLNDNGKTIILTTHIINDFTKFCKTLAFMKNGTVVRSGAVSMFEEELSIQKYTLTLSKAYGSKIIDHLCTVEIKEDNRIDITILDPKTEIYEILYHLKQHDIVTTKIENADNILESIIHQYL